MNIDSHESKQRHAMVEKQLISRALNDAAILDAMREVPRHLFVPSDWQSRAYSDGPLPIGEGQTISQPYIVALMTHLARPTKESRILDVGTGSGYQTAVLAELSDHVHTIEILQPLADRARKRLDDLGYRNIQFRCGDGYQGWPDKAPFDAILLAAAPDRIPGPLQDQLAVGGRLILPVGGQKQNLIVVERREDGSVTRRSIAPVAFVPMTGEAQA